MAAIIMIFFAVSAVLLYAGSVGIGGTGGSSTSPTREQTSTPVTTTTLPAENIELSVVCTTDEADVRVQASAAVNHPGQIISLTCSLTDSTGQVTYLNTVPSSEGTWEIVQQSGNCRVKVEAMTASCNTEYWEQDVSFTKPEFIWPIEPEYQMLLHDRYQVSYGDKTIAGYTHNNGLRREKHYVFGNRRNHYAFDITAAPDSEVHASADGTVLGIYTDTDSTGSTGYGRYIIIKHSAKHAGNNVYTLYAHLNNVLVSSGDKVAQGQTVALSGNTGGSRIPHLHLEFRLGKNDNSCAVDPLELLPERDFSLRRNYLDPQDGFLASSVALYSNMLAGGYDYPIPGKLKKSVSGISAGTAVEIISRSDSTITFQHEEASFSCDTSDLEYTFD